MGSNDMNHMQHIESVALSDCAVLQSKEATYQGSWKRAGGRSAWFMARRNMDRLLVMMKAKDVPGYVTVENVLATLQALDNHVHYGLDARKGPDGLGLPGSIEASRDIIAHLKDAYTADDIFGRIAQKPKGEDGTVLACMRDLRRYMLLVEAEMIAEGVVEPESKTYEQEQWPVDVYTAISNETGLPREEVKRRCIAACYSAEPPAAPVPEPGPAIGETGDTPSCGDGSFDTRMQRIAEKDVIFKGAREINPLFDKVFVDGKVTEASGVRRPPTEEELAAMGRTADDGAQHASLFPWEIGGTFYNTLKERVGGILMDAFFTQRTPTIWRLNSVVASATIPRELKNVYDYTAVDNVTRYVLNRRKLPDELQDQWPRLQQEMNEFEFGQSPVEFRFMYSPLNEKIVLRDDYADWAREA
jgi:hypothetical protein